LDPHFQEPNAKAFAEIDKLRKCKEIRPHYLPCVEAMSDLTEEANSVQILN
jgi:hypothetical protein